MSDRRFVKMLQLVQLGPVLAVLLPPALMLVHGIAMLTIGLVPATRLTVLKIFRYLGEGRQRRSPVWSRKLKHRS